MPRPFYRYTLKPTIDWHDAVDTLALAVLGATALHGETAARLDGGYRLHAEQRVIEVAGDTDVGVDLSRLFALYAAKEFGAQAFAVERVEAAQQSPTPASAAGKSTA